MTKTTEQFADALALLMEAYDKLNKTSLSFGGDEDDEDDEYDEESQELSEEVKTDLIAKARDAIEMIIDSEDHSTQDIANVIAAFSEAIQDIDPDVYGSEEFEEVEDEDDEDDEDEDLFDDEDFDDEDEDFEDFDDEEEDEDES